MEITNSLSEDIANTIQNGYQFLANQNMLTYAIILLYVVMATFALCYILKMLNLIKTSYKDVDHVGFRKINICNLLSILLFSLVGMFNAIPINVFFGLFLIPIIAWFIFMIRLFILNIKQYQKKKNFVKNKKRQAEVSKQLGVNHRISRTNLGGEYTTADEMYKEYKQDIPEEEQVCSELFRRRLSTESLQERRTKDEK